MAKRFTATEKWNDPWFRKLPPKAKLIWLYMVDSCDNAGFWLVDFELASFLIGYEVKESDIDPYLEGRVVKHKDSWEIVKFINFQYGNLSENCKAHKPILDRIEKQRVSKGYPKGIHTLVEVEVEKEMEVDKGGVGGTDCQKAVKFFGEVYQQITGTKYSTKKAHFINVTKKIKECGIDETINRIKTLSLLCQEGQVWPFKEGPACFTIETLIQHWNRIVKVEKMDEGFIKNVKLVNQMRVERGQDALPINAFTGSRPVSPAGSVVCLTGPAAVGSEEEVSDGGDSAEELSISGD